MRKRVPKEEKAKEEIYYGSIQILDKYGEHLMTRNQDIQGSSHQGSLCSL